MKYALLNNKHEVNNQSQVRDISPLQIRKKFFQSQSEFKLSESRQQVFKRVRSPEHQMYGLALKKKHSKSPPRNKSVTNTNSRYFKLKFNLPSVQGSLGRRFSMNREGRQNNKEKTRPNTTHGIVKDLVYKAYGD